MTGEVTSPKPGVAVARLSPSDVLSFPARTTKMAMMHYPGVTMEWVYDIILAPGDELCIECSYQTRHWLTIIANGPFLLFLRVYDYQSRWRGVRNIVNLVRQGTLLSVGLYYPRPRPLGGTVFVCTWVPSTNTLYIHSRH